MNLGWGEVLLERGAGDWGSLHLDSSYNVDCNGDPHTAIRTWTLTTQQKAAVASAETCVCSLVEPYGCERLALEVDAG